MRFSLTQMIKVLGSITGGFLDEVSRFKIVKVSDVKTIYSTTIITVADQMFKQEISFELFYTRYLLNYKLLKQH